MSIIKITNAAISGSLLDSQIPNLATSKITSGTFANSRISSQSVSQHVTSFDDDKLVNDISTLGLRVHTQENLNASNTNSASFDVFQDSSGVTGLTNVLRNDGEYMSSASLANVDTNITINSSTYTTYIKSDVRIYDSALAQSGESDFNQASDSLATGSLGTKGANIWLNSGGSTAWGFNNNRFTDDYRSQLIMELTYEMRPTSVSGTWRNGSGSSMAWHLHGIGSNGYSQTSPAGYPNISQASGNSGGMSNGTTYSSASISGSNWTSTTKYPYLGIFVRHSSANTYMYENMSIGGVASIPTPSVNATGSFEGATITAASSTSSMGAVITYQDNAGTNTLNTDIILKLSADNGSNYSTATLTALPDFATGIKMAKVNDLSVTAGTQLKYKIEFANQASGSKEARIRSVSLQF